MTYITFWYSVGLIILLLIITRLFPGGDLIYSIGSTAIIVWWLYSVFFGVKGIDKYIGGSCDCCPDCSN